MRHATWERGHFHLWGQRRPRSVCSFAQSDRGIPCPLTESTDSEECIHEQRRYRSDCTDTLIRICWNAGWSVPTLIAYGVRVIFLRGALYSIRVHILYGWVTSKRKWPYDIRGQLRQIRLRICMVRSESTLVTTCNTCTCILYSRLTSKIASIVDPDQSAHSQGQRWSQMPFGRFFLGMAQTTVSHRVYRSEKNRFYYHICLDYITILKEKSCEVKFSMKEKDLYWYDTWEI